MGLSNIYRGTSAGLLYQAPPKTSNPWSFASTSLSRQYPAPGFSPPPPPHAGVPTSSPKLLSPTQSDRSVVFLDKASPNAVAPATSNGCPEASNSAREVLSDMAAENATASDVPNFLVLRMHIVLACWRQERSGLWGRTLTVTQKSNIH